MTGHKPSWHTWSVLHVGHSKHYTLRTEVAGVCCFSLENIQIKRALVWGTCLTINKHTSEGAGGSVYQSLDYALEWPSFSDGPQNTSGWGCITSASCKAYFLVWQWLRLCMHQGAEPHGLHGLQGGVWSPEQHSTAGERGRQRPSVAEEFLSQLIP